MKSIMLPLRKGSMMDFIHGNYQKWCKACCLKEQTKYLLKEMSEAPERLKKLQKELKEIKCT